ncbi:cytochrome P450 [Mycena capillaripes]|nr:cytochrome P450 [Mycena capillaripes]
MDSGITSIVTGNIAEIYSVNGWDFHHELGEKYGGVVRVSGFLGEQLLYVFDPKALHQILVKDQDIFEETHSTIRGTRVFFGEGLFSTLGEQHKKQRKMLNPIFSPAHLRQMVPIFTGVAKRKAKFGTDPKSRLALELVGQAGLGYSFDPLVDDEIPPYIQSIKKLQIAMHNMALAAKYILPWAVNIGSPKFRRFVIDTIPWKNLHDVRDILDTLYATAVEIYHLKKAALEAGDEAVSTQVAQGKDLISILMKDNSNASSNERLSEDEIIGQLKYVPIFLNCWFIPQMSQYTRIRRNRHDLICSLPHVHILAQHPEAQEKLRQEIRAASAEQESADLTYDQLNSLEYLDAICKETLRLYPPASFMTRTCREDVALTTSTPITTADGSTTTEIPIPAETDIFISIISSNRNLAIWGPDSLSGNPNVGCLPCRRALRTPEFQAFTQICERWLSV